MSNKKIINSKSKFLFISIFFFFTALSLFAAEDSAAEGKNLRDKFITGAKEQLGKAYEYGSVGPDSFDSAGLIYYVSRNYLNKKLPRTAKGIYNEISVIPDSKKEPGDILFFKSKDSDVVTQLGIYIGDNKFISAFGDGDDASVEIFQLNNTYWKSRYAAVGSFLPSTQTNVEPVEKPVEKKEKIVPGGGNSAVQDKTIITSGRKEGTIPEKIIFDGTVFFDWSLLSPRQFVFRYRGIDALIHVRYAGWLLEPGLGVAFRYNRGLDTLQMPITFSMTLNDYVRLYAGPVVTFRTPTLIDTDKVIKASVFPGVAGISFTTPTYDIGRVSIQGVQDVSYTIYNQEDGATLSFMDGLAAGLVMYTGIRITFPISIFGGGK